MEKILIIANQFPPMGGSGVQRSVKFVKHLRTFGYEPIVFTRQTTGAKLLDETLLNDVPHGVNIVRTKAYEPSEVEGLLKIPFKVLSKIMIPDSARIWFETSKKEALKTIQDNNIKLIYTTSAPYSDHLLGLYIKRKLPNIQWVADFRDEWTNNPYTLDNPHNPIRTKIEKNMEKNVLLEADYLITNTPVMKDNFIKNNKISGDNFYVIPNGYDEEDFYGMDFTSPNNDKFTMVYTGALYGRRKPDNFFKAIKNLKEKGIIKENSLKVKLIGNYHKDKLQAQIDGLGLTKEIEIIGYVPHNVCIKHQLSSDALVLIEGSGVGANAFYTGKIFEYMNTRRPVLALLPDGVAKDLVLESKIGVVANTDDILQIEGIIKEYYEKWQQNVLTFNPDFNIIKKFERKMLTKDLANIFDKALNINKV
ncbi:glycosyltransferase family 4 protein [[Clostridium] colinum]|uniref:glycosyltransferase family 4 protein n=1 Tax=[Clostridium] colinum TaxID=36835 RepID=UPI0020245950|nr:glycosyltransferase family 4 protein [[Clostridium] colinum]